jgi:hypothetical protein
MSRKTTAALAALGLAVACGIGTAVAATAKNGPVDAGPSAAAPDKGKAQVVDAVPEIADGTWRIGDEVKVATYTTTIPADSFGCYWARLRGFSGEVDEIIANGTGKAGERLRVRIRPSDKGFETHDCGTWRRA